MAVGAAVPNASSNDPRVQLRIAQTAERKRRAEPPRGFTSSLPGTRYARGAMLGATLLGTLPDVSNYTQSQTDPSAATTSLSESTRETFRRAERGARVQRQIGSQVGMLDNAGIRTVNLSASPSPEESLLNLQQEYAARDAELYNANQQGIDTRLASAKRAERQSIAQRGLQQGLQQMSEKYAKELSAFGLTAASDAIEAIDAPMEDMGLSQGLVFIKNDISAVRTILDPERPTPPPTSIKELNIQATKKVMDVVFPRFNIFTMAGISGLGGFLAQLLFISFGVLIILISIAIPVYISNYALETFGLTGFNIFKTIFNAVVSSSVNSPTP